MFKFALFAHNDAYVFIGGKFSIQVLLCRQGILFMCAGNYFYDIGAAFLSRRSNLFLFPPFSLPQLDPGHQGHAEQLQLAAHRPRLLRQLLPLREHPGEHEEKLSGKKSTKTKTCDTRTCLMDKQVFSFSEVKLSTNVI